MRASSENLRKVRESVQIDTTNFRPLPLEIQNFLRLGTSVNRTAVMTDTIIDGTGEEIPGHRILDGTDLEIAYSLAGDDLVIRVNKGGVQVFRVLLEDAGKQMSERELFNFNSVSPDFVFKIGPTGEAIASMGYRLGQVAGKVMKAIRKS